MEKHTTQYFLSWAIFVFLSRISSGQVLPELPDLPSVQPSQTSSPSFSASIPATPSASTSAVPSITPTISKPPPGSPLPSKTPTPSPTPSEVLDEPEISPQIEEIQCVRDERIPAPTLGTSQLRYAMSVIGSAAAVALASVVYTLSTGLNKRLVGEYDILRFCGILLARLLIVFSIKISAALVASISSSDPKDGALDASGAFLTWGTAILTRTYYEAFHMTLRATGFFFDFEEDPFWDTELREYLKINDDDNDTHKYTLKELFFKGEGDRRVLIFHAFIYCTYEAATLIINLQNFVSSFSNDAVRTIFVPLDKAGQCGISRRDGPLLFGLIFTQVIFLICQQQSLVPLLTLTAASSSMRMEELNYYINFKYVVYGFFAAWIISLIALPLFYGGMYTIFIVGDISLFWQVMLGPPRYQDPGYIIALTYALLTTSIAAVIIVRMLRKQRHDEETQ